MNIKLMAVAGSGFGLGALLAWAITADVYEKNARLEKDALIAALNRQDAELHLLRQNGSELRTPMATEEELMNSESDSSPEENPESTSEKSPEGDSGEVFEDVTEDEWDAQYRGPNEEESKSNLRRMIDNYTADPDIRDEFTNKALKVITPSEHPPPYVIDQATYTWDEVGEHFSKITLTYYQDARVLLDDEEDPIKVEDYVGWQSLNRFGDGTDNMDIVFVRNERLTTDFEVERVFGDPPVHVRYGMGKAEFRAQSTAGLLRMREEDRDRS